MPMMMTRLRCRQQKEWLKEAPPHMRQRDVEWETVVQYQCSPGKQRRESEGQQATTRL